MIPQLVFAEGYITEYFDRLYRLGTHYAFFDFSNKTECPLCIQSVKGIRN